MRFYADLHIHSKYSRATSRNCDLEHLAIWGRKKGIGIVGTGDFTHPAWRAELKDKLVPAEPGLFRLRPDIEKEVEERLPPACRSEGSAAVRFMLSVEISTIYKKLDKTRKIHHLIYTPDFDAADRVVDSLSRIGNLHSDGRPILGLDSRHLLEIALESGPDSYLVPAHIWTPWFAALGSKSGFDAIDECYGDLAPHIFAVETGLSSDPPMNWRVSSLDRFRLVSNSDAHSPEKLGREVCVFDTELDYFALRGALETGRGYEGTLEFFPEEGKYHLDGHRHCHVRLSPGETRAHGGRCPACGKPLTVGVMHRVEDLADRPEEIAPPATAGPMQSLIPLPEVLSEIHQVGPKSKKIASHYEQLLGRLGPELPLLSSFPLEDVERAASPLVAEALSRLRKQEVIRSAGYDGVYGTIRLFDDAELREHTRGASLFEYEPTTPPRKPSTTEATTKDRPAFREGTSGPPTGVGRPLPSSPHERESASAEVAGELPSTQESTEDIAARQGPHERQVPAPAADPAPEEVSRGPGAPPRPKSRAPWTRGDRAPELLEGLDADQRRAAETATGPVLVVAGPGSGKTRTLTHRIAHLVTRHCVPPEQCLAITFTRRAAGEMRERLRTLLPNAWEHVALHTFHSLGLAILRENHNAAGLQRGFRIASDAERVRLLRDAMRLSEKQARSRLSGISQARRTRTPPAAEALVEALETYQREMETRNLCDLDDLVIRAADALESTPALRAQYRQRWRWVSIDEYQDVDLQQVRLVKLLVPEGGNLCAIGDPDQAIYSFRGADLRFFAEFEGDFPGTRVVRLTRNYRSDRNIVTLSAQVIAASGSGQRSVPVVEDVPERIAIHEAPTEKAEAEFIVQSLERILGGHSFFSIDSGRSAEEARGLGPRDIEARDFSFSDFAVLYRTDAQVPALVEALSRSGMPFQRRSHRRLLDHPGVGAVLDALRESPGAGSLREGIESLGLRSDLDSAEQREACELLIPVAAAYGDDLERFRSDLALGTEVDAWDPSRGPDLPAHPPRRQGARVPRRLHRRLRERASPAAMGQEHAGGARRRAAPLLRRRHPGEDEAVSQPGKEAPVARGGARAAALSLLGRHRRAASRTTPGPASGKGSEADGSPDGPLLLSPRTPPHPLPP